MINLRTKFEVFSFTRYEDMKCAASGSLEIQDAKMMPKIAIWAPSHNFVGLYLRN